MVVDFLSNLAKILAHLSLVCVWPKERERETNNHHGRHGRFAWTNYLQPRVCFSLSFRLGWIPVIPGPVPVPGIGHSNDTSSYCVAYFPLLLVLLFATKIITLFR